MTETLRDRVVAAIGNQYEIQDEIGRGGMSVVYRARDLRLNRSIAIKVLPPELAYDPAIRTRFTREAQTSAHLSHGNIVPIYDVGDTAGIAYFVMAYISGGSLASLLAQEPRLSLDETRRILCEVADALALAHLHGVVHRDIKPDNILLDDRSGRAMVTDFGIARAMEGGTRLTVTGIAVGTPTYMSPEQAEGVHEVDGRSDLYSLGVLGYQMLTGRVPFTAGSTMALLLKHVTERPRPIAELRPDAPRALRDTIERALMKSREDRWPSASAMRDALMSGDAQVAAWRSERREPVRYTSPIPDSARRDKPATRDQRDMKTQSRKALPAGEQRAQPPLKEGAFIIEQGHLRVFTPEQRADIRLWNGRVNLRDRIRAFRWYIPTTLAFLGFGIAGFIGGLAEGVPPAVFAPFPGIWMTARLWKRGKSLRAHGVKLRRALFMPRSKWVLPKPQPDPFEIELQKLAPREILDGPHGALIRRAAEERDAILELSAQLAPVDREMLPDLQPTANALVQRVAQLAGMLHRFEEDFDPRLIGDLDDRITQVENETPSPERERRLTLLQRQRGSLDELVGRRSTLSRQIENAALALGNLRLDLIRLRSSGMQSALSDVTSATQEARALSREIGAVLEAAADVRGL